MPYIDQNSRQKYSNMIYEISNKEIETKGDLEYLVFVLMRQYMKSKEYRYSTLHDCVYGVIHAGEEFKRRFLDVREISAMEKNGDID